VSKLETGLNERKHVRNSSLRRESEIAVRLDRNSLGGALATSMLLDRSGKADAARRVRETALSTPLGPDGRTIAQALAGFGKVPQGKAH